MRFLKTTAEGRLDLRGLGTELTSRCRLVALTHCSNVTGALTDVARIVAAARTVGAMIMLDGAQRAPHALVDVRALDIDFYAFSGHKTYGPTGIGVLWGRSEFAGCHATVHDRRPDDQPGHPDEHQFSLAATPL